MESTQKSKNSQAVPLAVWFAILWNVLLGIGSIWLSWQVFNQDVLTVFGRRADLGKPVQYFLAILALLPLVIAIISSLLMIVRKNNGRYLALTLNLAGAALAGLFLLDIWGFYDLFEKFVDMIMANGTITVLGFALAYALFWLSGRLKEESSLRLWGERISIGIAMLTLIVILFNGTLGNEAFQEWHLLKGLGFVASQYFSSETAVLAWGLSISILIFIALIWFLLHLGDYFGETTDQRNAWQGWFMLAPNIIGFMLFFAGPLLLSLYLSFTNSSVGVIPEFNWGANYAELFSLTLESVEVGDESFAQNLLPSGYVFVNEFNFGGTRYIVGAKDRFFWITLFNTLKFCLYLLPIAIIPAIGMALVLNSKLPGVQFFRAIYFLPSVAAVVGTALIWRWLYNPATGYINYAIQGITDFLGIQNPDIQWLSDPNWVLFSVVLLAAWQVVGYNTVLILAGLQGISTSLYEAAQIDGANRVQQLWSITLPMLQPTLFFVTITTMVTGLQVFNEPYTLFPALPIPENARTSVYYMYQQGFNEFQFGYASAIAWVLFIIIFSLTLLQFRFNRSEAY